MDKSNKQADPLEEGYDPTKIPSPPVMCEKYELFKFDQRTTKEVYHRTFKDRY